MSSAWACTKWIWLYTCIGKLIYCEPLLYHGYCTSPVLLLASPAIDTSILIMIILRAWFHDGCLECARSLSRSIPHIYCRHTIVLSQVCICPFVVPKPLRTGSFTFGSGVSASLLPRSKSTSPWSDPSYCTVPKYGGHTCWKTSYY